MSGNLILVLNCGSSSLKFAVISPQEGTEFVSGLAECFNLDDARIKWKVNGAKEAQNLGAGASHAQALAFIVDNILGQHPDIAAKITAVGHRIVHGGEAFTQSAVITDAVLQGIRDAIPFAPLHNPAHLIGIEAARKALPHLAERHVAVFDTAFHQTMPKHAYLYALPHKLYKEHGIRRYGAHGTSNRFIVQETAHILGKKVEDTNIINCHLGNGASITAIKNGECVDTSMGLTPLAGLVMGTRCGDVDPSIIFYLCDVLGYRQEDVNKMFTKESGFLGLTDGASSDCRYIEENYGHDARATEALDIFCYRLAKYIMGYTAAIGKNIDAITFTGGIGENSSLVREKTLQYLSVLNIDLDPDANEAMRFGQTGKITGANSGIAAFVVPTNEEWIIAKDTDTLTQ